MQKPNFSKVVLGNNKSNKVINEIKFKRFKHSQKQLPEPWEEYNAKDVDGADDCFQEMYIQEKKSNTNIAQCVEEYNAMDKLKRMIIYYTITIYSFS
ncbi:hypothetical protein MTBBW1_2470001 [Desulfamplus magnetovallimortis]|uniref:Uncharacterized protein n=1 Tax=Desulfamplus magnetovallimortis TaxID=1246637 RepID=A0A1W1HE88_9BACT|nr:hypothetical protein MTBBW1_2470001 [Desulfamplus magnetovallimortis]